MIISQTPLRMSFAGGGSDLREYYQHSYGSVLSTTIDKFVYILVNHRSSGDLRVSYSQVEYADSADEIEHNLVREALKMLDIDSGLDIAYMSDMLPGSEGSGLGASSSILVGTLNALHAYKGEHVSARTLAEEACKIEIDILEHPIGKQDQYAAAYGGFNFIWFSADESVYVSPVIFNKAVKESLLGKLLLFYTGMNMRSDAVLTEQKRDTEQNIYVLDEMVKLSEELQNMLYEGNLGKFGEFLHDGWMYKKKLASNITNTVIDSYYNKARDAGAIGGKILGSGGGGFLLLYCEKEHHDSVRRALSNLRETSFEFESLGSRIIFVSD